MKTRLTNCAVVLICVAGIAWRAVAEPVVGRKIVILADRSGSMSSNNRIDYLKFGIQTLLAFCSENDTVAVMPFADLHLGIFESKVDPENISAFFDVQVKGYDPKVVKRAQGVQPSGPSRWSDKKLKDVLIIEQGEVNWGTKLSNSWSKLPEVFGPPARGRTLLLITDAEELHDVADYVKPSKSVLDLDGYYCLTINTATNTAKFGSFWDALHRKAGEMGNRFSFRPQVSAEASEIQEFVRLIAARELAWLEYPADKIQTNGVTTIPLPGLVRTVSIIAWGKGVNDLAVTCDNGSTQQPQFQQAKLNYKIFRFKKDQFSTVSLKSRPDTVIKFFADFNFFILPRINNETDGNKITLKSETKVPLRIEFFEKSSGEAYNIASKVKAGELKVRVMDKSKRELALLDQVSGNALVGELEVPYVTKSGTNNYELEFKVTFEGQGGDAWDLPGKSVPRISLLADDAQDVGLAPPPTNSLLARVGQATNLTLILRSTYREAFSEALRVEFLDSPDPKNLEVRCMVPASLRPGDTPLVITLIPKQWAERADDQLLRVRISHSRMKAGPREVTLRYRAFDSPLVSSVPFQPASLPGTRSAGSVAILNRTGSPIDLEATVSPLLRGPSKAVLCSALLKTVLGSSGSQSSQQGDPIQIRSLPNRGVATMSFVWERHDFRRSVENYRLFGAEFAPGVYVGEVVVRCSQTGFQTNVPLQVEIQAEQVLARSN